MGLLSDSLEGLNVTLARRHGDVDTLIKVLETGQDPRSREDAAEALGGIHDHRVVEPLIAALKDSDHDVREEAAEALGKIGDPRARGPLTEALTDPDHDVRKEAERALRRLD